jgi:hypothetical protein
MDKNIPTLETGNTSFATNFPPLNISVFFQITDFSHGIGLMDHAV